MWGTTYRYRGTWTRDGKVVLADFKKFSWCQPGRASSRGWIPFSVSQQATVEINGDRARIIRPVYIRGTGGCKDRIVFTDLDNVVFHDVRA